jgi:hypothetical protein
MERGGTTPKPLAWVVPMVPAGPVPAAVQVWVNYDAAIPASSSAVEGARALLKYFTAPAAPARWQAAGLELAGD